MEAVELKELKPSNQTKEDILKNVPKETKQPQDIKDLDLNEPENNSISSESENTSIDGKREVIEKQENDIELNSEDSEDEEEIDEFDGVKPQNKNYSLEIVSSLIDRYIMEFEKILPKEYLKQAKKRNKMTNNEIRLLFEHIQKFMCDRRTVSIGINGITYGLNFIEGLVANFFPQVKGATMTAMMQPENQQDIKEFIILNSANVPYVNPIGRVFSSWGLAMMMTAQFNGNPNNTTTVINNSIIKTENKEIRKQENDDITNLTEKFKDI